MFDEKQRFIIEDYSRQATFSSFLPGISGMQGIPLWSFYVNRGQGIASFGIQDKEHSILEFYPAHQAYQFTKNMGFRTFIKINNMVYEPFRTPSAKTKMYIGMNELEIQEINMELGIQTNVIYYTLPDEKVGGLVRQVTIKNIKSQNSDLMLEVMDGLPSIIPAGISLTNIKEMAQTMKAWMQVEDVALKTPYYRARYSTKDSASIQKVEEGNFFIAYNEEGEKLPIFVDPNLIFEQDTSYEEALGFQKKSLAELLKMKQITQNQMPCGLAGIKKNLGKDETLKLHIIIGQVPYKESLESLTNQNLDEHYFQKKYQLAKEKTKELAEAIYVKTGNAIFDGYCQQTYIDNVLRGGYPIRMGSKDIFYVYARKHGDIERDYNFFSMLPEYYSQGNGNYRDVNQNRRSDVLFSPFVKDYNIKLFYNLVQLDGYNPLVVKQISYNLLQRDVIRKYIKKEDQKAANEFFNQTFSPGKVMAYLERNKVSLECSAKDVLNEIIDNSKENMNAEFGEGYWTDHWTYNLDLVESYLLVYPEDEERLLFMDKAYTYYKPQANVNSRGKRYHKTKVGVRQQEAVNEFEVQQEYYNEAYSTNLFVKILIIITNKFATIDMAGMGIEMEAGKPGWYDALNGLPGIFGSSMAETYELSRVLAYMIEKLECYQKDVTIPQELYDFMVGIDEVMEVYLTGGCDELKVWNNSNYHKEHYRQVTSKGVSGVEKEVPGKRLVGVLNRWDTYVKRGIAKACKRNNNIPPTYFTYDFDDYIVEKDAIIPINLRIMDMPLFLEGIVRFLKLSAKKSEKKKLYEKVKETDLYDKKLEMYKVNGSLSETSFEVGRAKAFTPGWLENESIWLHMEYKYLLEELKADLHSEFIYDLNKACIPFLDYTVYGRSLLENSSFIVSSANENEQLHGRGFVARLSGSTAEFLQIWQIMMFGKNPFQFKNEKLSCEFQPLIPAYLIGKDRIIEAMFLGKTLVKYYINNNKDVIPGNYKVSKITLLDCNDKTTTILDGVIPDKEAKIIRNGEMKEIIIDILNA